MYYKLILFMLTLTYYSCEKEPVLPDTLPDFEKAKFSNSTNITNPYYGPAAGKKYTYFEGKVGEAPEEVIVIQRRTETKKVAGINCVIHHDLVAKNGVVIEDTDDWVAQDDEGNVWYMGEYSKNYTDAGIFEDTDGSWEADVEEAEPGYWIVGNPVVGQKYHQEFFEEEAEDQAEVIAVGVKVTIPLGTYENCIVTKDFTNLEPGIFEKKYYAPGIGFIKEEKFENNVLVEELYLAKIE